EVDRLIAAIPSTFWNRDAGLLDNGGGHFNVMHPRFRPVGTESRLARALTAAEAAGGGMVYLPAGEISVGAAQAMSLPLQLNGAGPMVSTLVNTTADVTCLDLDGTAARIDRASVKGLGIEHQAATKYAIRLHQAPFA